MGLWRGPVRIKTVVQVIIIGLFLGLIGTPVATYYIRPEDYQSVRGFAFARASFVCIAGVVGLLIGRTVTRRWMDVCYVEIECRPARNAARYSTAMKG